MTLIMLLQVVAAIALVFTVLLGYLFKLNKNWIISFFQNFCGLLFIVSGFVKAADPMGTAFKMEDYFNEFIFHFDSTWFSFLTVLFEALGENALPLSVVLIVFEMVLGLLLILGYLPKFTAWSFFGLVVFFTLLTGFTFTTGYVPQGNGYFNFGEWTSFSENNMRVTDCGCFGDFIKLEPKVSFLKDLFLLIPALMFIIWNKKMHTIFKALPNFLITLGFAGATLFFSLSNFAWDIPALDFRPFKVGNNIADIKQAEEEAQGNVDVLGYKLTNKVTKKVVELGYQQYMSNFKMYPAEEWEIESILSEPEIELTKISDFIIYENDEEITQEILAKDGKARLVIVSHKAYYTDVEDFEVTKYDTIYRQDTILQDGEILMEKVIDTIETFTETDYNFLWEEHYKEKLEHLVDPIGTEMLDNGIEVYLVIGGGTPAMNSSLQALVGDRVHLCSADNIMLKTIIRSNPGFVLFKDGQILGKWHKKKATSLEILNQLK